MILVHGRGVYSHSWRAPLPLRAVDQDVDVIDILVQEKRDGKAAKRFFNRLLTRNQGVSPWKIVTDKLASYSAAKRELIPSTEYSTVQYENNGCQLPHQPTRQQERQMRTLKSQGQAQCFLSCHGVISNLFRPGCHLMQAKHYRLLGDRPFR